MKSLKIGLVGCGRISKNHVEALKNVKGLELAAVCDIRPERAEKWGQQYDVPMFTDYEEMLAKAEIDMVDICTPSGLHPKMGILAAKNKKHVITEKPMAISLKEADDLIRTCDDEKVKLFVIKQNRLNPPIQLLKKAIDKGRFGRIFMANMTVRWTRPQEYYDLAKWRGTWEFDGGAFMNQSSHYVDLMLWLVGPASSVVAKTATFNHQIEVEDSGAAIVRFRNGAIGVMDVTMCTYPKNLEGSITIVGEKGTAKISGIAVNKVETWNFSDYDDDDKNVELAAMNPPNVYGFGHTGYLQRVADALLKNNDPEVDGRSGRKSLELILGIYESAKTGKEVALPLKNYF